MWEAHFTITTNCVKQWRQLIGRKLLSEPSDTLDCILSALQLLSSEPISGDRKYKLICKHTMAQSIKTAGSFARNFSSLTDTVSVALFLPFGIIIMALLSHFSLQSVLTGRLMTSEYVDSSGSSGSGIDEISHNGRELVDTCKILHCQRAVSQPVMTEDQARKKKPEGEDWTLGSAWWVHMRGLFFTKISWCECSQTFGKKRPLTLRVTQ